MSLDKHVNVLCGKFRLNLKLFQRRTNSEKTAWSFHLYVEREKTIFAPVLLTVHSFIYPHMRWLTANTHIHTLSLSDVHTQILSSLRSIATRPRRTSGRKLETLSHYHQHLRVCDRERKRKREREKENYWFWPLAFPRSTVLFSSTPHPPLLVSSWRWCACAFAYFENILADRQLDFLPTVRSKLREIYSGRSWRRQTRFEVYWSVRPLLLFFFSIRFLFGKVQRQNKSVSLVSTCILIGQSKSPKLNFSYHRQWIGSRTNILKFDKKVTKF